MPTGLKVYGGHAVAAGDLPGVVALARVGGDGRETLTCSGALIAPDVVLTAGHCLQGGPIEDASAGSFLKVYTGDGEEGGALKGQYEVKASFTHPLLHAHPLGNADFGVIVLRRAVVDVKPLPLVTSLKELLSALREKDEPPLLLAGFGRREDGGEGRKYAAAVSVRSHTSDEAVVGGGGKDACDGDSGGPLLTKTAAGWQLLGVMSRGVEVACGPGVIAGLATDAVCWLDSLPEVRLPQAAEIRRGCFEEAEERFNGPHHDAHELCMHAGSSQRESLMQIALGLGVHDCHAAVHYLAKSHELNLDYLMLRDISPLAAFTHLRHLSLKGNRLTSVESLRHLNELRSLELDGNNIRDLSPLAPLIARGLVVYGAHRQLWNYTNTRFLSLCHAAMTTSDRLPTSGLIADLIWQTAADDCTSANQRLLGLTELDLGAQHIGNLDALSDLESLQHLDLSFNPVWDLTPLAGLEHLRDLTITGTGVQSLAPLAQLLARGLRVHGFESQKK